MSYFSKKYHAPGTSPGTLAETAGAGGLVIRLIDYTATEFTEKDLISPAECHDYLDRPTITWIHVQGTVAPETLRHVGELFELHPLALEDVINAGQRPKAERYGGHLFVVACDPSLAGDGHVTSHQVSLFAGENFVISFHSGPDDPFEPVRARLRKAGGRIRTRKADYLLYALLDLVIDGGFPLLETLGDAIEETEADLLERPDRASLHKLHAIKRDLLLLRRMLWPQREAINALVRDGEPPITDETRVYLRDCYDHTTHIMELLESYREMTAGMLDIYLSSVSNRMNDVMRVLTIIATIFIPLTFIVGVYGMNFAHPDSPWAMPELRAYYGYPAVWLVMLALAGGMLLLFKRKGWF
ncbi:MAG: magnesium/cobalt transporter CorA [Nitrospirae bacterium]|nr:magnesium/cobalt transporter CorA [Nitrospirota bacterium]